YMLGHVRSRWNVHLSVWVVAIIFSFIHLQALGFFSRLLLGGFLGYFVVYGGSLYSSIAAHFVFNATAILAQAFVDPAEVEAISADAAKPAWYLALISAVLTAFLLNRYRQSAEEATPDSPSYE
ncbi:MAG: CPBP family intramembrane metalloprotease, partial [Bacteroidia bacterium]|nr:CPBP family intramembrane metalloprotease [Bacteroidia bacterium]